jgi:hypothetical protein
MPSNVVTLYEPSTYIVRVIAEDMYTYIVKANTPKDAEQQCLSRTTDAWLPEDVTSMRRLSTTIRRCNRVDVSDLTGDE